MSDVATRLATIEATVDKLRLDFSAYIDQAKAALGEFYITGRPLADCIKDMHQALEDEERSAEAVECAILDAFKGTALPCDDNGNIVFDWSADHLRQRLKEATDEAYRKGQEDMRSRAATVADCVHDVYNISFCIATDIRTLPIKDTPAST